MIRCLEQSFIFILLKMVLWQGFFRKSAKTTQKTTKFTTWRRFIWATFALTKLFNCLRLLLYVQIQSPNAAKNKAPSDDGALFFAAFGDGAKNFFAPLPCLGALPLLYPGAAPPSVFASGKYTAPAVAPEREYVVGFIGTEQPPCPQLKTRGLPRHST